MVEIDSKRLWRRLEEISQITDRERPWTRRSFSPLFLDGRRWLSDELKDAGLDPIIDEGGNLVARIDGTETNRKPIVMGSHSDTVPSGGRYDGILGVMTALEVMQSLNKAGEKLRHPLEIVDFLAEEASEFGLSCIGSRAFSGSLSPEFLDLTRPDGLTLREGLRAVGGDPDKLESARRQPESIAAYVEVHIEQGRVLENEGARVGVVTEIAGIHRDRIILTVRADHAGATPMSLRSDALVGAAAVVQGVYQRAQKRATEAHPLVATVGKLEVSPNAINAIAGKVELILEVRSGDDTANRAFSDELLGELAPAIKQLGLGIDCGEISHSLPTPCSNVVREAIHQAAADASLPARDLPSGAGHDGVFVSQCGPIGMIFVPCRDGLSHTPEESIEPYQAADGARVLMNTVLKIDENFE